MKPARSCERIDVLAELLAGERPRRGSSSSATGEHRRDQLDQAHHRDRVEEVEADHVLGPVGRHGQLHDRDGRRVRRQDRVRRFDDLVELREDLESSAASFSTTASTTRWRSARSASRSSKCRRSRALGPHVAAELPRLGPRGPASCSHPAPSGSRPPLRRPRGRRRRGRPGADLGDAPIPSGRSRPHRLVRSSCERFLDAFVHALTEALDRGPHPLARLQVHGRLPPRRRRRRSSRCSRRRPARASRSC